MDLSALLVSGPHSSLGNLAAGVFGHVFCFFGHVDMTPAPLCGDRFGLVIERHATTEHIPLVCSLWDNGCHHLAPCLHHLPTQAGEALGPQQWQECGADRGGPQGIAATGAVEGCAPADHLLWQRGVTGA